MKYDRRDFLKGAMAGVAALSTREVSRPGHFLESRQFKISCAGWSFHREVFDGKAKQIDLFRMIRDELNIEAFELVNTMLEVPTAGYINRLKKEADKYQLSIPLIMIDDEGALGHEKAQERNAAVRNHAKWV